MRHFMGSALFLAWMGSAIAQSPPLDNSTGFFAGEWAGTGERGSYCYLNLSADRRGIVLIDSGSGDWLGARLEWHNRQQSLQIGKVMPLPFSAQRRIMPLSNFVLRSGFNHSLSLTWSPQSSGCHMQKIETTARQLTRARTAIEGLPQEEKKR
jgi:hypothetical protein